MISQTVLDDIRSRVSLVDLISRSVAIKQAGRYWQGLCPFHEEKTPSFYILPTGIRFRCFGCGANGDVIEFLRRTKGLDFRSAIAEICNSEVDLLPTRPPRSPQAASFLTGADPGIIARIAELWQGATHPGIAEFYLRSRDLLPFGALLPAALKGHAAVRYVERCGVSKPELPPDGWRAWRDADGEYWSAIEKPAMLAAVTDAEGSMTAILRIWCETRVEFDGTGAAALRDARAVGLAARKKCLGRLGRGAVRLAAPGRTLGLAEGVETAMAAMRLFRVPVWATCGSGRLHAIDLPASVQKVLIMADRGKAGEEAAARAVSVYGRDRQCSPVFPDQGFGDFNEQLMATTG